MSGLILPEGEGKSPHSPSDLYALDQRVSETAEDFQAALQRALKESARFIENSNRPALIALVGYEDGDQTVMVQHSMLDQDEFEDMLFELHNTAHASRVKEMPAEINPDQPMRPSDFIDQSKVKGN